MAAELAWTTASAEETEALGEALGRVLPAGAVVALRGELGSGKTTLVRGLARGLGIPQGVASPTYTLMQAHEGGRLALYHYDAWMEGREKALLADGAGEWLGREGVSVVEWADRVAPWLPMPRIEIDLVPLAPQARRITLRLLSAPEGGGRAAELDLRRALADLGVPPGGREHGASGAAKPQSR